MLEDLCKSYVKIDYVTCFNVVVRLKDSCNFSFCYKLGNGK